MGPLVSVIIPVYNVLPYLREALDSVINQTYHNLEIIIVDDGSTDGSSSVCDEYKRDTRVKVIHQENRGLSGARNTGMDLMTGEYVAFLDSDDAFYPDMVEKLVRSILQNNVDLAVCGYDIHETNGKLAGSKRIDLFVPKKETILTSREALTSLLEESLPISVWNKVYAARIWTDLRFPEGFVYEDLRVMPHAFEKCSHIAVIPQTLVHYRKRRGSISQTGTIQNLKDLTDALEVFRDYMINTQSALLHEKLHLYYEKKLRFLIFQWAEMRKQGLSNDALNELIKLIYRFANQLAQFQQTKTKAAWWLFCHYPSMLRPFQDCFGKLRSFSRKIRGIAA